MELNNLGLILAQTAAPQQNPQAELMKMIGTFVVFGVIFYFVLIRPQQRRAKQQAELLKSVKSGDRIVTSSGILGVIVTVKEKSLTIRSADTKMEITKSAVAEIVERAGESSDS